jgi:hypothetical protein
MYDRGKLPIVQLTSARTAPKKRGADPKSKGGIEAKADIASLSGPVPANRKYPLPLGILTRGRPAYSPLPQSATPCIGPGLCTNSLRQQEVRSGSC